MNRSLALTIATLFSFGCSVDSHTLPEPETLSTVEVSAIEVTTEPFRAVEPVAGTVRARLAATVSANLPGRILKMPIRVGQRMDKAHIIAVIEAREIQARVRQAKAVLAQAKMDYDRYASLHARQAATRQELEGRRTALQVARATVQEAESALDEATVRAPFAGVVTQQLADVGDLATPGRPLVALEAPGDLRLEVAVSERLVGFLAVGTQVPVEVAKAVELEGVIGEISPSADANSRTFLVKVDLPEHPKVRTGQFGRARLPTRRSEIMRMPVAAVIRRGQLELVFVIEDELARLRLVRTGRRFGEVVEVVAGLDSGEVVVIDGARQLSDGQPVRRGGAR